MTAKLIPFNQIYVPPNSNVRVELGDLRSLAKSISTNGLLEPIAVTSGGEEGKQYTLTFGYRRMGAMALLKYDAHLVLCTVKEYGEHASLKRLSDHWSENAERSDISYADKANMVHRLFTGSYPAINGEKAMPQSKESIMRILNMSRGEVNRLLVVAATLNEPIMKTAFRKGAPARIILMMVRRASTTSREQILKDWEERRFSLEAVGRQRRVRRTLGVKHGEASLEEMEIAKETVRLMTLDLPGSLDRKTTERWQRLIEANMVKARKRIE